MRGRNSDVGPRSEGDYCSTWYRWVSEAKEANERKSVIKEEKRINDGSIEGNSNNETCEFLRDKDEQEYFNGGRLTNRTLQNSTEQQFWQFSSGDSFYYLGGSLSSLCGDIISSEEVVDDNSSELVDNSWYDGGQGDDFDVDTFEEEFEDFVYEYACAIYCKPVSGIHKYVSSLIVPDECDGVYRSVKELETLIDRYPPRHWYILASNSVNDIFK